MPRRCPRSGRRANLATLLGNTAVRGGGGHGRMRRAMVVVQVALSLVLLSAGGRLVVRSFERLLRADPGFTSEEVFTARIPVPGQRYPDEAAVVGLYDRLAETLSAIPGVSAVSGTSALPLSAAADQTTIVIPGAPARCADPVRRRHELAVRMAVGADQRGALRLVLRDGVRLVLLGILIGLPATWMVGQAIRTVLVDVSPSDPLTFAAVAAGLGFVALLACKIPARRVLRIAPATALLNDST